MTVNGTLSEPGLRDLVDQGQVTSDAGIADDQLQPASIDLTLASEVFRLPGSILPLRGEKVRDLCTSLAVERLSCTKALCLARDGVYLVRLREHFALPEHLEAYTNSKSSTGRIDLATRVICDGSSRYDRIPAGYRGEVWVELIPRSFDVVIAAGDSVNQAIVFGQRQILDQAALSRRHEAEALCWHAGTAVAARDCLFDGRLVLRADLSTDVVGWVAHRSHVPLVLSRVGRHDPSDFFTPLHRPSSGLLFLEKDRFYILATRERVVVPPDLACEMVPFDASAGEFRAHYAGFFDPGWGCGGQGGRAVLEVRPHADDLVLRDAQPICAMAYEQLSSPCNELYGSRGNNYASQNGPRLSKHFVLPDPEG
jgi:dCTP deaminase